MKLRWTVLKTTPRGHLTKAVSMIHLRLQFGKTIKHIFDFKHANGGIDFDEAALILEVRLVTKFNELKLLTRRGSLYL